MFQQIAHRHLGMDLVRAFAILTVLIGHALIFFPNFFSVQWLIYLAVFGVELFFALSGFLIGNILIRLSKDKLNFNQVFQFWLRRWLRTIPVYLVIVLIIMLVNQKFYFSYLFFIQNLYPEQLKDFQISWSLSIEEWFYISFPLLMYLINKLGHIFNVQLKSLLILLSVLIFIAVPFVLRLFELNNTENWDLAIRKQIHLRLDGIAYGVLLAYLYDINKHWFVNRRNSVFTATLLLLSFMFVWWLFNTYINIFSAKSSLFNNLVFYPLINIYCALFVAYFIRFQNYVSSKIQKTVLFISLISYSLYLVHFPVYQWFAKTAKTAPMAFVYLAAAMICMFIIGTILYKTIEKPFIDLRNKWTSAQVTTHL